MLSSFDLITVFTIVGILGILALYIIVVYKKGWLKKDSGEAESNFLCSNPECRKTFTEPAWLTDNSKTPSESFPACPYCHINLSTMPALSAQKNLKVGKTFDTPSLKEYKKPMLTEKRQASEREKTLENPIVARKILEPTISVDGSKGGRKTAALSDSKLPIKALEIEDAKPFQSTIRPRMQSEEKPLQFSSKDCPHFFGYVPKNAPIPDECLGCHCIVVCLTQAKRVEA